MGAAEQVAEEVADALRAVQVDEGDGRAEQQAAAGCPPEMVRLSIGLETIDDILEDIDQALTNVN